MGKQWMLYIDHMEHTNTLCELNARLLSVNPEAPVMSLQHYFALNNQNVLHCDEILPLKNTFQNNINNPPPLPTSTVFV